MRYKSAMSSHIYNHMEGHKILYILFMMKIVLVIHLAQCSH